MTGLLTASADDLAKIFAVLQPAAALGAAETPTHFTETILVTNEGGTTELFASDGFRMHRIEVISDKIASQGTLTIGVAWLAGVLKDVFDFDKQLIIQAKVTKVPKQRSEEWTVTCGEHTQTFDVGGEWPNPAKLIDHSDYEVGVGFRPDFFMDMATCAKAWWNHKEEEVFPLVVKQMSAQKVSTFTIKNQIGRLRMDIMPVIFDEDDE